MPYRGWILVISRGVNTPWRPHGFPCLLPSHERQIGQRTITSTENGRDPSRRYFQAGVRRARRQNAAHLPAKAASRYA
jgi:hypothetical protein